MSVELSKASRDQGRNPDRGPIVFGRFRILFGLIDPIPEIPGYTLHARADSWMMVERDDVMHYVQDDGYRWTLYPQDNRDEFKTRGNPTGAFIRDDQPIHIVKREG